MRQTAKPGRHSEIVEQRIRKTATYCKAFGRTLHRIDLALLIQEMREDAGLTQAELAKKVGAMQSVIALAVQPVHDPFLPFPPVECSLALNFRDVFDRQQDHLRSARRLDPPRVQDHVTGAEMLEPVAHFIIVDARVVRGNLGE